MSAVKTELEFCFFITKVLISSIYEGKVSMTPNRLFTRQIKVQTKKSTSIILSIKGKYRTLARKKHHSVHFFRHGLRLFHLSTEKVRVQSVRNEIQSDYSRADTINYNINKDQRYFHTGNKYNNAVGK